MKFIKEAVTQIKLSFLRKRLRRTVRPTNSYEFVQDKKRSNREYEFVVSEEEK